MKKKEECEDRVWSVKKFPVEVGCRAYIGVRLQ